MPSAITEIPSIVLIAYADASARADHLISTVKDNFQPALDAALTTLKHAKDIQLPLIEQTSERAYNSAQRTYEQQYRLASNNHGLAITRALRALDERKAQILAQCDDRLQQLRADYDQVCTATGAAEDPRCLPVLDVLRLAELEANLIRDQHLAESHAIYLQAKESEDAVLAQRLAELNADKTRSLEQARHDYDVALLALIPPREQAVLAAQGALDAAMNEANAVCNELRKRRLELLTNFNSGNMSMFSCARRLDQIG